MDYLQLSLFVEKHDVMPNKEYRLDPLLHSNFIYVEMQHMLILWTYTWLKWDLSSDGHVVCDEWNEICGD